MSWWLYFRRSPTTFVGPRLDPKGIGGENDIGKGGGSFAAGLVIIGNVGFQGIQRNQRRSLRLGRIAFGLDEEIGLANKRELHCGRTGADVDGLTIPILRP